MYGLLRLRFRYWGVAKWVSRESDERPAMDGRAGTPHHGWFVEVAF
jgi:hypothetical protein